MELLYDYSTGGKGFKYSKSRPKLTYKNRNIKLEISFWSSGCNIPDSSVVLEIIPSFFSLQLAKNEKEKGKKSTGYILGYPELFIYPVKSNNPRTVKVKQIFDKYIEGFEEESSESILKLSNRCNIYGITVDKFI